MRAPIDAAYLSVLAVFCIALAVAVSAALLRLAPSLALRYLPSGSRVRTLDGLRGLLALSVVAHHSIAGVLFGRAVRPPTTFTTFQNQLGSCAVAIFFMLSAYLFCGKLLRSGGRLNVRALAGDRFARIVPVYLTAVLIIVVMAIAAKHFTIDGGMGKLLRDTARLSSFDFLTVYSIDGTSMQDALGQRWTLRYEWILYACLPVLALAMRASGRYVTVLIGLALLTIWDQRFAFFVCGAAAAPLVQVQNRPFKVAVGLAGALGLLFGLTAVHDSNGWLTALAYLPFLVAVAQAERPYDLLASRPLQLLGEISFSVYLFHGIAALFSQSVTGTSGASPSGDFMVMLGRMLAALLLALLTYALVEKPSMRWRAAARRAGAMPEPAS